MNDIPVEESWPITGTATVKETGTVEITPDGASYKTEMLSEHPSGNILSELSEEAQALDGDSFQFFVDKEGQYRLKEAEGANADA